MVTLLGTLRSLANVVHLSSPLADISSLGTYSDGIMEKRVWALGTQQLFGGGGVENGGKARAHDLIIDHNPI